MIWTAAFWRGAGERAVQTFAQTFLASVVVITGAETVTPAEFIAAPWATAATTAGLAAAVSLVKSLTVPAFTAGETRGKYAAEDDGPPVD